MNGQLHITLVNEDQEVRFADWHEPLDDFDTPGDLFRALRRQWGRCTGRVYVDRRVPTSENGGIRWEVVAVSWHFVKRNTYEDSDESYLQATWASIEEPQQKEPA